MESFVYRAAINRLDSKESFVRTDNVFCMVLFLLNETKLATLSAMIN